MGINRWITRLFLLASLPLFACAAESPKTLNVPLKSLDLEAYLGEWFEIGKLPNSFQENCWQNTQASYSLDDVGEILVRNRCEEKDGSMAEAQGLAWRPDPAIGGALKVSFVPFLKNFQLFGGDYWVLATDYTTYALVGHPGRTYLWILSRTPAISPKTLQSLLEQAKAMGYPVERLEYTTQTGEK